MHSIVASEIGNEEKAFFYFYRSLVTDLKDLHGNTAEGIHAASLGGTWQAAIFGFAGMRIKKGTLSFDPKLPDRWKEMDFKVVWRNSILNISLSNDKISIFYRSKRSGEKIFVRAYGTLQELKPGKPNEFYETRLSKGR